jgi:hypothetical protein
MRYGKGLFSALLLACAVIATSSGIPTSADTPTGRFAHILDLLVGSWLVTYDVQAFGFPIPILLSFTRDGVMIETDTPAPTPVGNLGTPILSNGHGEWEPTSFRQFSYLYRKLVYQEDGLTPFGTTRTTATGTIGDDGAQLKANLLIEFLDLKGNVLLAASGTATGTKIGIEKP